MKDFTESMRYEYPLTKDDLVWDVGGYEGNFAKEIHRRYGCRVWCFEPVFTGRVINALKHLSRAVEVFPCGLGATNRTARMKIKGDSTGLYADSGEEIAVDIRDISEILDEPVALLKLNCEGSEWEIIEALVERDQAKEFRDIQVQFHPIVPDWERRYEAIAAGLSKTHELTYRAPFCWENWTRK